MDRAAWIAEEETTRNSKIMKCNSNNNNYFPDKCIHHFECDIQFLHGMTHHKWCRKNMQWHDDVRSGEWMKVYSVFFSVFMPPKCDGEWRLHSELISYSAFWLCLLVSCGCCSETAESFGFTKEIETVENGFRLKVCHRRHRRSYLRSS